jgi:hypothetical protein
MVFPLEIYGQSVRASDEYLNGSPWVFSSSACRFHRPDQGRSGDSGLPLNLSSYFLVFAADRLDLFAQPMVLQDKTYPGMVIVGPDDLSIGFNGLLIGRFEIYF